jgi:hypothetical protein
MTAILSRTGGHKDLTEKEKGSKGVTKGKRKGKEVNPEWRLDKT